MRWFLRYKHIIVAGTLIILAECFVIYDYDRVRMDFRTLKAFLRETRHEALYEKKEFIVRFNGHQAAVYTKQEDLVRNLSVPTLHQVNYDTTLGRDMVVFTPSGTSKYNLRIHGGDFRLKSWLGFRKNIAVNCTGLVSEGVYPEDFK